MFMVIWFSIHTSTSSARAPTKQKTISLPLDVQIETRLKNQILQTNH